MFIAHLPAGYITGKLLHPRIFASIADARRFVAWSMLGSVAPDFDLLYFYLVDHRQTHHHKYISHWPLFWEACLLISWLVHKASRRSNPAAIYAVIFSLSGLIHLLLDSIVGDIWWFAPFINKPFALATVQAIYKPWWINFFLHWSFGLELAILMAAVFVWRRKPQQNANVTI